MLFIYSSGQNHESGQYTPILYIHNVPSSSIQGHLKHGKDISENSSTKHWNTGRHEKENDGWKEKLKKKIYFGLNKSTRIH